MFGDFDVAETEDIEAAFAEVLHRRIVVGAILVEMHRIVERVLERQICGLLQSCDVLGREVADRRRSVRPQLRVPVGGDDLETALAMVGVGIVAGALDPERPDQVEEFLQLVPIAVVRVPTGDVKGVGELDAAPLHLVQERDLAELGQPPLNDREVTVGEEGEGRAGNSELVRAEPGHDAVHHAASPLVVVRGRGIASGRVGTAIAAPRSGRFWFHTT